MQPEMQLNLGLNIRIPGGLHRGREPALAHVQAGGRSRNRGADGAMCAAEFKDRYGEPPGAVRNLLSMRR